MPFQFPKNSFLGNFTVKKLSFDGIEEIFQSLKKNQIHQKDPFQKSEILGRTLVNLLKSHEERKFLLVEVLDFIDRVHQEKILEKYSVYDLELWMNQFSGLTSEENYFYRALIVGKWIPRDDYQVFFPIGMGKVHQGSHFVTAHQSPDIDTIVSSFWGWMDAFAARVGSGLHIWNVPGGPPESSVEVSLLFDRILHPATFEYLSKNRAQLTVTSFDLMTQQGVIRRKRFENSLALETDRNQPAVVLIDDDGYYLGDWRPFDVESIRQVVMLLNLCLRWIETTVHMKLFSLFSKEDLEKEDFVHFEKEVLGLSILHSDPVKEMTLRQQSLLESFLKKVLGIERGMEATFLEIASAAEVQEVIDLSNFWRDFHSLVSSELFDKEGKLHENRRLMFFHIEKIMKDLNEIFRAFRSFIDTLDIAYKIKTNVYGHYPQYLSHRTDVKEIENQMGSYPYLTVNIPGPEDKQIPVGIIKATDLKKPYLATATLRDFCNREETKVPSYLEVISVIDHHKSSLSTNMAPTAIIGDSQSVNSLVCQLAFSIHDEYSSCGMSEESVNDQIKVIQDQLNSISDLRILQRLYKKKEVLKKRGAFYVDPYREFLEYLQYLYAILDDTDLLTKVSKKDVVSVADLLNRLKTIAEGREVEIVNFDDLENDASFAKKAASRLVKNQELYSLYSVSSKQKEFAISENFKKCSQGETSDVFTDTKVQNGCCRVGQTKMFDQNYALYKSLRSQIRDFWYQKAIEHLSLDKEVDLHLHMISTIASAEELYKGELIQYAHKDEMWIYIPDTDLAVEHLKLFLNAVKTSPVMSLDEVYVECYGKRAKELSMIFKESFIKTKLDLLELSSDISYAVIYYRAASLNSRKAMVSPHLPKISK
jgi:hypothetical protein